GGRQDKLPAYPEAAAGDGAAGGNAVDIEAVEANGFSALENLRDRVVIMLLFNEVVQVEQVEQAWREWKVLQKKGENEALWRILAAQPDIDRDRVFAEAADVYVFKKAEITASSAISYLRGVKKKYTGEQWEEMDRLGVVPIGQEDHLRGDEETRFLFATHDPTRPEVHNLMQGLGLERFELHYAPESSLRSLMEEAFPPRDSRAQGRGRL
ncbi:MAG: hypothetical protein ACR2GR_08175, partial [Rhodothermales bacterium]